MRSFKSHSMLFGALAAAGLMANLGCGQAGAVGFIEPNTTLVFELKRVAS